MPLRFTKTEKWDKPWFMQLSPYAKLLFLYLADRCDLAGIWEINMPMASMQTGLASSNVDKAMSELMAEYAGERKVIQGRTHLWLVNFIRHQRNLPLNPDNRAHRGIIESLSEHSTDFGVDLRKCLETNELASPFKAPSDPLQRGYSSSTSPSQEGGVGETKGGELFARFWKAYPRKAAKDTARNAFARRNPDEALLAKMLGAIEAQKHTDSWKRDHGRYIPSPAKWLDGGCWEDSVGGADVRPNEPIHTCHHCGKNHYQSQMQQVPQPGYPFAWVCREKCT